VVEFGEDEFIARFEFQGDGEVAEELGCRGADYNFGRVGIDIGGPGLCALGDFASGFFADVVGRA